MTVSMGQRTSPQARGRELAKQGRQLWQKLGSVRLAAAELTSQHRDIPVFKPSDMQLAYRRIKRRAAITRWLSIRQASAARRSTPGRHGHVGVVARVHHRRSRVS